MAMMKVKVGDRVRVRLQIVCDRNLEYIELKDPRCAAFEPVSTKSGWRWNSGLSYYIAVTNTAQTLYIDRLEKGSYIVEYDMYVNNANSVSLNDLSAGVEELLVDDDAVPVEYYDAMGRRHATPQQGVNIVKMSNGTVKKVLVK